MAHTPNHPSQNDQTKRDMPGKGQDQGQQGNKKTEQGKSSLGFTRVAPRTFDPSRAAAPPPVPEARRQLLLNYFIRK